MSTAKDPGLKPITVTVQTARDLLGVGNTLIWAMIKDGRIRTVNIVDGGSYSILPSRQSLRQRPPEKPDPRGACASRVGSMCRFPADACFSTFGSMR